MNKNDNEGKILKESFITSDRIKIWEKGKHLANTVDEFRDVAESQELKGLPKYGQPLDPLDLKYDWLGMATEEQVDGFKYLVAEKRKRAFIADKITNVLSEVHMLGEQREEVMFWLDQLRGNKK